MRKVLLIILVSLFALLPVFSEEETPDLELSDEMMSILLERLKAEGITPQEEEKSWWQRA